MELQPLTAGGSVEELPPLAPVDHQPQTNGIAGHSPAVTEEVQPPYTAEELDAFT
jgi:hypothetical protein